MSTFSNVCWFIGGILFVVLGITGHSLPGGTVTALIGCLALGLSYKKDFPE